MTQEHTDSIGNETFYTVLCRWPREIRLFTIESTTIENDAEALEAVKQNDNAAAVFRHDYDIPRKDVSEDIARLWLDEMIDGGFNPEEDNLPPFIEAHIGIEQAIRIFVDGRMPMAAE